MYNCFDEFELNYISIEEHEEKLSYIEHHLSQLIEELYDECETVDKKIVHVLICDLCTELNIKLPNEKTLKI